MTACLRPLTFCLAAVTLLAAVPHGVGGAAPGDAAPRVAPATVDPPRGGVTRFHFSDMPVRSALQLIAEEGGVNLVVSDAVQGTVTLHLDGVTWEQALAVVLRMKGLRQQVQGSTRTVSPAEGASH
jgi:hypothetical protein